MCGAVQLSALADHPLKERHRFCRPTGRQQGPPHPHLELDRGGMLWSEHAYPVRQHLSEPRQCLHGAPSGQERLRQPIAGRQRVSVLGTEEPLAGRRDVVPVCRCEHGQVRILEALAGPEQDLVAIAGPEPVADQAHDARRART